MRRSVALLCTLALGRLLAVWLTNGKNEASVNVGLRVVARSILLLAMVMHIVRQADLRPDNAFLKLARVKSPDV